jgi:peroxiredoxin
MTADHFTQAEIASGIFKTADTCPVKGQLLRDFGLLSTEGRKVSISDYRGRANLVLVFAGESSRSVEFLAGIAKNYRQILEEQAEVLAILDCTPERATRIKEEAQVRFPVLVDPEGRVHRLMGALDESGEPAMALYITDRFGEVFATFRESEQQVVPGVKEILGWLAFVNSQCPECSPPEWPV